MTPAQREAFGRTQALMSLLEGASNHVMHAVGARILPGFDELHERFEGRHRRRGPMEQLVLRVTGLDLKMEQYAEGERFVAAVVGRSGAIGPGPGLARAGMAPDPGRDSGAGAWLARVDALDTSRPAPRAERHGGGGGPHLTTPRAVRILTTPVFGAPLPPELVARIEAVPGTRVTPLSRDGLAHGDAEAALAEAEVLLRGGIAAAVLDHVIERAPALRWVHSISAGVDKVVTPLSRQRGLQVTNARGVFSPPIAEYVVMMCLAIARRLPQLFDLQRERTWQPLRGEELGGLTVGIVGYGSIGAEVARLLEPFGTRVIATRRHPERGSGARANVEVWGADRLHELLRHRRTWSSSRPP